MGIFLRDSQLYARHPPLLSCPFPSPSAQPVNPVHQLKCVGDARHLMHRDKGNSQMVENCFVFIKFVEIKEISYHLTLFVHEYLMGIIKH